MKKIIALSVVTLALAGCGTLTNQMDTDQGIAQRTSMAIGIPASDIKISHRSGDLDSVTYTAKAKGNTYECYYSSAIVVKSDAICTKMDGTIAAKHPSSKNCNALLHAAHKC